MSITSELSSARFGADVVEDALRRTDTAWKVLSALRAEGEARFVAGATAFLLAEHASMGVAGRWSILAPPQFEGSIGVLEERACDHLAAADLASLARAIPSCTGSDVVDLFLTAELGDADATTRIGRRLAEGALGSLPDELRSDALGCRRLYAAMRIRFTTSDDEVAYLNGLSGMRLLAAGSAVLAEAHGQAWPEVIPSHGRGATNASRALTFAIASLGPGALAKWLGDVLGHSRAKGRVECAGLAWDERFDGVGSGQAVTVRRHGLLVMTESGSSHAELAALPNRPRRALKVHKTEEKAKADFAARVADLTARHGLARVDPSTLGTALQRAAGSLPSDFALALLELGAPSPGLFWHRSDPEETRRAIALGADAASELAPDGRPLLAHVGPHYWDVQRAEVLVAAGARLTTSERLVEAARRGELAMARLLVRAGAPITSEARDAAKPWPRLHQLLAEQAG